jgi:hypothetical protein
MFLLRKYEKLTFRVEHLLEEKCKSWCRSYAEKKCEGCEVYTALQEIERFFK